MISYQEENLRTLEAHLGLSENEAISTINTKILVSNSFDCESIAADLIQLLSATITVVKPEEAPDIEVCIGVPPRSTSKRVLALGLNSCEMMISNYDGSILQCVAPHGLVRKIACCFAAGAILSAAMPGTGLQQHGLPFRVDFANLGILPTLLNLPITLRDAALIGAGGVANGFLWGIEELNVSGELAIVDPKTVSTGNLNRCLFFDASDLEKPKAEVLAKKWRSSQLGVKPFVMGFNEFFRSHPPARLAISTLDTRESRRELQNELPLAIIDASTTDVTAVVVHSHVQPTDGACLGCIYRRIVRERQHEEHVASKLGVSVDDVLADFVTDEVERKLKIAMPDISDRSLVGMSLHSLFKQRCADQVLLTTAGKQTLAPLAFVSNLAGLLLALELVLVTHGGRNLKDSNYLSVDPWRPPHNRIRRVRERNYDCEQCGTPQFSLAMASVWGEEFSQGI
jgi:E1 N-terminal domain/ThiF family